MKKYFKLADCEAGQLLVEGIYTGKELNKFNTNNYNFRPEEGPTVSLSGGHLTFLMENNVKEGQLCQVVYLGTELLEKGAFKGKTSHQFEVAIADSPSQLVSADQGLTTEAPSKVAAAGNVDLSDLD